MNGISPQTALKHPTGDSRDGEECVHVEMERRVCCRNGEECVIAKQDGEECVQVGMGRSAHK